MAKVRKLKDGHIFIEVVSGREGNSLSIGDEHTGRRIAGPKPWGGGEILHQFQVDVNELREVLNDYTAKEPSDVL